MNPTLHANGYTFKPHELPMVAGSPATPDHPAKRKIAQRVPVKIQLDPNQQNAEKILAGMSVVVVVVGIETKE